MREQAPTFEEFLCNTSIHIIIHVLSCKWSIVVLEETKHFCGLLCIGLLIWHLHGAVPLIYIQIELVVDLY